MESLRSTLYTCFQLIRYFHVLYLLSLNIYSKSLYKTFLYVNRQIYLRIWLSSQKNHAPVFFSVYISIFFLLSQYIYISLEIRQNKGKQYATLLIHFLDPPPHCTFNLKPLVLKEISSDRDGHQFC